MQFALSVTVTCIIRWGKNKVGAVHTHGNLEGKPRVAVPPMGRYSRTSRLMALCPSYGSDALGYFFPSRKSIWIQV
jgi:hypothetical protein